MNYNFDEPIDRRGTNAEKIEGMKDIWGRTDLFPCGWPTWILLLLRLSSMR